MALRATEAGGRRGSADVGSSRGHSSSAASEEMGVPKPRAGVPRVVERTRPRSAVAAAATSGDDGEPYWTVSRSIAARTLSCRECKGVIYKGQSYVARDGRKIRLVSNRLRAAPRTHTRACSHTEPLFSAA